MTTSAEDFMEALNGREVRITYGTTLSLSQGSLPCAAVEVRRPSGKWARFGPLLVPKRGEGRVDLMRLIANLTADHADLAGVDAEIGAAS